MNISCNLLTLKLASEMLGIVRVCVCNVISRNDNNRSLIISDR